MQQTTADAVLFRRRHVLPRDPFASAFKSLSIRFDTAINNISLGLCFFNRHRRLIASNRRYAEMYGLQPSQVRPGMTLHEILALRAAHGSMPDMTSEEYIRFTQAPLNGLTPTIVHLRNGRIVSVRHQPIEDGGYVSTHEDITEQWTAQAAFEAQSRHFSTVLENISQGVCLFDGEQRLIASNRRYAQIYSLSPEQVRPGMTLKEIVALRAVDGGVPYMTPEEYLADVQARSHGPVSDETIVRLKNGRTISIGFQPMPDGGWVATHEDVTERWVAEAALRHGEKLRAIGQLTGGIAHDLSNLLTVIGCGIESASMLPDAGEETRTELETTMQSVNSATALLRRMMSFARSQPPALERTDLNVWLMPLRDLAARTLGSRYRLELKPDPALPPWPVDRSQLESAVLNLILNARDAMPDGGAITIETESVQITGAASTDLPKLAPGRYAAIVVRDNGPGMSPEVAARAFEPFYSTKPAGSGTGLGLSMVQQFVLQAGGGVALHSAPGAGTSVRIVLPGAWWHAGSAKADMEMSAPC